MTVNFFTELEWHTTEAVWYQPMQEDDMTELPPEQWSTPSSSRQPVGVDEPGVTVWISVDLIDNKLLVHADGIDVAPAGTQGVGNLRKGSILTLQNANSIATYFSLTAQQRDNMVGGTFGRAIYGLLLDKPALENGQRRLYLNGLFHVEVE